MLLLILLERLNIYYLSDHIYVVHNYSKQMKIGLGFDKYPEQYNCIATFKNVSGIEGEYVIQECLEDDDPTNLCELTLFECNLNEEEFTKKFKQESELYNGAAYLYILSSSEQILTSNFISDIEITKLFKDNFSNLNVKINGWLQASSKGFYEITEKRLKEGISVYGEWKILPHEKVQGWLDSAIRLGRKPIDISNKIVTINSDGLDTEDKFYCAIGEAVNGPGGYFGRDLLGLSDCLTSDFGVKGEFTLIWINHQIYKNQFPKYFKSIQKVFSDYKQELILK